MRSFSLKPCLLALFGSFSLTACAQQPATTADAVDVQPPVTARAASVATVPGTPEHAARKAVESLNPQIVIDRIGPAQLPGFQEVIVAGQVLYVSDDGKYMLQGSLYDMQARKDISQVGMDQLRRELLAKVPTQDRIVFAPENPKYTVSVFTDVECGYCQKLHNEMADYNRLGIAIEYLAYPRMGLGSEDYRQMVSVWCAPDRNKAMTDAKQGRPVPARECANPVATHFEVGQRAGLTGTPMIITAEGVRMPGYMPPEALLSALEGLDAERATAAAANGGSR